MNKLRWVSFLHMYQPPWQSAHMLSRVVRESYEFLLNLLEGHAHFRTTLNITGALLDLLEQHGHARIIARVRILAETGRIELTGSSYSHAFLPQLPEREVMHQITLQEQTLLRHFPSFKKNGFFLPEMAYSPAVGKIIKAAGYSWIILDPACTRTTVIASTKYISRRTGLTVVFRNRRLSRAFPPEEIFKMLNGRKNGVIITATDAELYGHFHTDWQEHLKRILSSGAISVETVSQYLSTLARCEPLYLRSATWESRGRQIKTNNAFSVWCNRSNPIHQALWRLAHLALDYVSARESDPNFTWARSHLDRGLASCTWWWASGIRTSVFGPIAWHPEMVECGALELIKSIRSLKTLSSREKIKAESLYSSLVERLWSKHWKEYDNATR